MTESLENELTPEEKLLQVIRDGDADNTVADESADKTVAENKPELKLVEKDRENQDSAGDEASVVSVAPDVTAIDANLAVVEKSRSASLVSIGFVNKILTAIVIAMIGLAIYEIWYNIKHSTYKAVNTEDILVNTLTDQDPEDKLPPITEVLTKFAESKFIGKPDEIKIDKTGEKVKVTPVEDYIKKNLNLIGLSGDESIISDGKTGKMHFLKLADSMMINEVEVTVENITSEYVELSDGDKKIRIK